jgi:Holliday junction resolvase RusA-like endonuclease
MPNSWSKKKKAEFNGKPHQQKPDLDNLIKAFKDALCEDDSYVHTYERMRKIWGEEDYILIHNSYKNE